MVQVTQEFYKTGNILYKISVKTTLKKKKKKKKNISASVLN